MGDYIRGKQMEVGGITERELSTSALSRPFISATFAYNTASPLDFGTLGTGDILVSVDVVITTAFNDPSALLAFGLVSSPGNILPSNSIDPATVGTYNNSTAVVVTGSDALRLQIVPGASSQGAGTVIVTVRRP